jgi:hypothetical protein
MSSEVAPFDLLGIIAQLAQTPIEGPAARIKKRYVGATDVVTVLCDCSGSMTDLVGSSGISKFRHLQIALQDLQRGFPKIRLIAFGSTALEVSRAEDLPDPGKESDGAACVGGSTNLAGALELAGQWKPRKTIIVSDGLPDSESQAKRAAQAMTGGIDAIYCGPDAHPAVSFLRSLCRDAGGVTTSWDGRAEISGVLLRCIAAPEAADVPKEAGSRP